MAKVFQGLGRDRRQAWRALPETQAFLSELREELAEQADALADLAATATDDVIKVRAGARRELKRILDKATREKPTEEGDDA